MKTPNKIHYLVSNTTTIFYINKIECGSLIQNQNSITSEISGSWHIEKNIPENIYKILLGSIII